MSWITVRYSQFFSRRLIKHFKTRSPQKWFERHQLVLFAVLNDTLLAGLADLVPAHLPWAQLFSSCALSSPLLCFGWCNFLKTYILQGSVSTRFGCGENFNDSCIVKCPQCACEKMVKIDQYSAKIWTNVWRHVFYGPQCISATNRQTRTKPSLIKTRAQLLLGLADRTHGAHSQPASITVWVWCFEHVVACARNVNVVTCLFT